MVLGDMGNLAASNTVIGSSKGTVSSTVNGKNTTIKDGKVADSSDSDDECVADSNTVVSNVNGKVDTNKKCTKKDAKKDHKDKDSNKKAEIKDGKTTLSAGNGKAVIKDGNQIISAGNL